MTDTTYTIWHADCGCQVTMDPDTGEPEAFVVQCPVHASGVPSDIAAESRAMTIARMAIAAQAGIDIAETTAVVTGEYGSRTAHSESPDGKWVADVSPLTLELYIEANAQAASFAKAT